MSKTLCRSQNSNRTVYTANTPDKINNSLFLHFSFFVSLRRASGEVNNDIVVEMKTDKANEEAGLLNKRPSTEQVRPVDTGVRGLRVVDLQGFGQQ